VEFKPEAQTCSLLHLSKLFSKVEALTLPLRKPHLELNATNILCILAMNTVKRGSGRELFFLRYKYHPNERE
jgi:hypothetical protein